MTEQEFFSMDIKERALMINEMLSKEEADQLKVVAEKLGINYSKFTKEMQRGNLVYIKRLNKYCQFTEDLNYVKTNDIPVAETLKPVEVKFLQEHMSAIRQLIDLYRNKELVINRTVLEKGSTNRTFKLNDGTFNMFTNFCKDQYPQYRIQDVLGQALWEFVKRYSN